MTPIACHRVPSFATVPDFDRTITRTRRWTPPLLEPGKESAILRKALTLEHHVGCSQAE